jgi:beta-lysine 5,6-aminomutase alpha subunit
VERSILRLYGLDGANEYGVPLPNVVVDQIHKNDRLGAGVSYWVANAMEYHQIDLQELGEMVDQGKIDLTKVPKQDEGAVRDRIYTLAQSGIGKVVAAREKRDELFQKYGRGEEPLQYVIVATGNIYEDVKQAQAAARQGADVIAVIRTTAQSLLDYVPYGATTEGFGGTTATQENFRIMRQGLDEVGEEIGKYIRLTNYCSGLCMPEIAAMGALERLDMMLNDSMYGIIFRDINMQRTFVDQYFSRMINGFAGITINTGEDNYLTTADAYEAAHTVIASQFINEQFAYKSGLKAEQMGLGHAYEINPEKEDSFVFELAQALLVRQIFPDAPLKYMPPTKYMTGNIFRGYVQNTLFNIVTYLSSQGIHLLGMLTEAIHTPHIQDRFLALQNSKYISKAMKHLPDEIMIKEDGIINRRAQEVLEKAVEMLEEIAKIGLMAAIEKGMFADISRKPDGGKGLNGVVFKEPDYLNPFVDLMLGGKAK